MTDDDQGDANIIICPNCQQELWRIYPSPMLDCSILYCDQCANSVEVDYYDPIYNTIYMKFLVNGHLNYREFTLAIEQRLKPCNCGGHFKYASPRRCYKCLAVVFENGFEGDLFPMIYGLNVDERDPTPEELAIVDEYITSHVRSENIWN
jgi:hypothetical protein